MNDKRKEIEQLIDRAAKSHDSQDAMRFSQAACNAANAMCTVINTELTNAELKKK